MTVADVNVIPAVPAFGARRWWLQVTMGGTTKSYDQYSGVVAWVAYDPATSGPVQGVTNVVPDLIFMNYFGRYRVAAITESSKHYFQATPTAVVILSCSKVPAALSDAQQRLLHRQP